MHFGIKHLFMVLRLHGSLGNDIVCLSSTGGQLNRVEKKYIKRKNYVQGYYCEYE